MRNSSVQHEQEGEDEEDDNDYWPPTREWLHRATVEILSLHGLPKVCGVCSHTVECGMECGLWHGVWHGVCPHTVAVRATHSPPGLFAPGRMASNVRNITAAVVRATSGTQS
jgi:hypothetical protein